MAKPTLLQTLLGRPSQSYSFPQEKDYHSTKPHMRRVAAEAQQAARVKTDDPSRNSGVTLTSGRTDEASCGQLMGRTQVRELNESVIIHSSFINRSQHLDTDKNVISGPGNAQNDDEDRVQDGEGEQDYSSQEESEDNDEDDDNDIFYTPNTTPRSSMAGSNLVYPTPTRKRVLDEPLASSTPFDARSTTSSSTATSDTHSIFSTDSAPVSDSTRITTPYNSESGHDAEVKPTARRRHEQQQRQQHAASSRSRRETVTRVNTERVKRNSSSYTDEDWAKDVRWLVSPDTSQKSDSSAKSKKRRSTSGSSSVSSSSSLTSTPSSPSSSSSHHSLPPSTHYVTPVRTPNQPTTTKTSTKQKKKSIHAHNPSIMMSMAALLEEDEDAYIIKNSARGRTTSSPDITTEGGDLARSNTSKSTSSNARKQSVASNPKPHLVRRRSRSLEDIGRRNSLLRDDLDDVSSQSSAFASSRGNLGPYAPSLPSHGTPGYTSLTLPRAPPPAFAQGVSSNKRASILGDVIGVGIGEGKVDLTRSGMAQTTMASVEVVKGLGSVSTSGSLRNPFAFFGFGKQQLSAEDPSRKKQSSLGFTSWRKPPNYVPGNSVLVQVWAVGVDGVDVRLAGVSLGRESRGERTASADPGSNLGLGQGKRGASESEIHHGGNSRKSTKPGLSRSASTSVGKTSIKPWHRRGSSNGSLPSSITVKTVKASKSGSGGSSKAKIEPPEVGYIPGRSFIGRVLEVGWEVNEDAIRKGEWVVGLLDVRKCGALQEFIVVDRHKVYRVPHPTIPSSNALVDPTDSDQDVTSSQRGKTSTPAALVTLASLTLNQPQHQPSSLSRYPIPTPFATSPSISSSSPMNSRSASPSSSRSNSLRASKPNFNLKLNSPPPPPTLQELALIPLCGVPAYRAVRTLLNAFASSPSPSSSSHSSNSHSYSYSSPLMHNWTLDQLNGDQRRRRALVLRGHDGVGSMAVQMLVRKGWRVCVHAPVPVYIVGSGSANSSTTGESSEAEQKYMTAIEDRMRRWGAEEVIFDDGMSGGYHHHRGNSSEDHAGLNGAIIDNGDEDDEGRGAIVRVIERLIGDGDVFDAVLDTVGGKEIWEASERLLRNMGSGLEGAAVPSAEGVRGLGATDFKEKKGLGSIGSIRKKDRDKEKEKEKEKGKEEERREKEKKNTEQNHRAEKGRGQFTTLFGDTPSRVIPTAGDHFRAGLRSMKNNHKGDEEDVKGNGKGKTKGYAGKPGYAWVSIAQDVDWDGEDVRETIGTVMKMALNEGVRPWVGDLNRVVPFERTPDLFVEGGPLVDGGTAVVKIVE